MVSNVYLDTLILINLVFMCKWEFYSSQYGNKQCGAYCSEFSNVVRTFDKILLRTVFSVGVCIPYTTKCISFPVQLVFCKIT